MTKMCSRDSLLLCVAAAFLAMAVLLQTEARDARPRELQKWYLPRIKDTLPLLEHIRNCRCPRVYIPVCGSDNQSYVNVCKMNCYNQAYKKNVELVNVGACLTDFGTIDTFAGY